MVLMILQGALAFMGLQVERFVTVHPTPAPRDLQISDLNSQNMNMNAAA